MSALDRARQLQPGSTVRWDRLEREAFIAHPEVLGGAKPSGGPQYAPLEWMFIGLALVVGAVLFGSPIWGFVTIAADGGRFATAAPDSDPGTTIPVAGAFYACALVLLVVLVVRWLLQGRPKARIDVGFSTLTGVLGTMTAISMAGRGRQSGVQPWEGWLSVVLAATVLGFLYALVHLVVRLRHQAASTLSFEDQDELDARLERAARLDEAERAAIRADLEAAIDDLHRRGLVTKGVAERARRAELGGLGLTMNATTTA